ncbi:MAG TPA: tRNA (adenosine(37)-N6)-threonylcarbamoyltransferase complex dimerization subunit type 1 TsaB [Candidatus Eisenbacteria bacterium]|nr:tRNA (adenosine(37)-N6)-threonylcarbamoyltransferase complex dimerization subunit type 1 TsaB [Candidatus Eisenbacteria bacterium]
MRYILGIDTAGADGSVALAGDGELLASGPLPPGGHSGILSDAVGRLTKARGISLGDLDAVGVSQGPGSFTGLRIGLAWAKGVALGRALPLVLVSAHEAMAHAHRAGPGRVATLIPGERGRVEAALWERGSSARLVWGPEPVDEEEAVERLLEQARAAGQPSSTIALAPSNARLATALEDQVDSEAVSLVAPAPLGPAVAEIADRLFLSGRIADWASASPAYGRAPNARKPVS